MRFHIKNAEEAQLDALARLDSACFAHPWTCGQLRAYLPDDRHELLLAQDENGRLLGYVGMMTVLDEGYLDKVAVAEDCRRQGVGSALICALLQRARARELAFVTLEVRRSNAAAQGLYAKHGFVPVGLRKNYYQALREDAVLMTHYLERGENNEDPCL